MIHLSLKTRNVTFALSVVAVFLFYFHKWAIGLKDYQKKGRILRAEVVLLLQCGLGFLSFFVWRNVSSVFSVRKFKRKGKDVNNGKELDGNKTANDIQTNSREYFWKILIVVYLFLAHGSYISNAYLVRTDPHIYSIVSYFMLGLHIQMATGLVLVTILNFFLKIVSHQTLKHRTAVFMAITYAVSISMYGFYNVRKPPVVKHETIPVKDLPSSLDGLTITHIPDIHLGPMNGRQDIHRVVKMVNDIQSDMVVIVGDLVDGQLPDLKEAAAPISNIRTKLGTFFVTGNHEYYAMDVDDWFVHLKSLGVTVLHNSNVLLPEKAPPSQQICLAGTDDIEADRIGYKNHGFNLYKAVQGCPKDLPVILLAHQPKAGEIALQSRHRVDLVLSGHTHGGQMFPLLIGAYLANPYYVGLYPYGQHSHIYVSQGTNFWGIPMRTFTSREITVIKLKRKIV